MLRLPILKNKTYKLLHGLFHCKVRCSLLYKATLLLAGSASNSRLFCCRGSQGSKHTCKDNNKTGQKAVGLGWQNNHFAAASCIQNVAGRGMWLSTPCPFCRIKKAWHWIYALDKCTGGLHCCAIFTCVVNTHKFYACK